jgi:molybdate transport system substrate-binding protein
MTFSCSRIPAGNKAPARPDSPDGRRLLRRTFVLSIVAFVITALGCRSKPAPQEIVVGAATSMRHVFPEIVKTFERDHPGPKITVTYGASGDVARQVEAGAGVDIVVFAGKQPLDKLVSSHHVDRATTKVIGTNELVLIASEKAPKWTFQTLDSLPAGERLAIGDPKTVPVGQYARDALEKLKLWDKLQDRIVLGTNVAAVLAYLQRGEVAAAIVYRTEVQGVPGITVLDTARGPWAPRPEIWMGVVQDSHNRAIAQEFADFLTSSVSQRIFSSFGFGLP